MAPDSYMSYRFFLPHFRRGINQRGAIMHEEKCKDFFMEFIDNCIDDESFSVLCGFLCHFALDSSLHPLVNQLANSEPGMHEAIEHTLDMIELQKKDCSSRCVINYFSPYYESTALNAAIKKVYGWEDDYLKTSYRHQKLYYWICSDRYGLINRLLKRFTGKLSSISYHTKKCTNLNLEEFDPLVEESILLAIKLISSAFTLRKRAIKEIEFAEMIGNRTYIGVS